MPKSRVVERWECVHCGKEYPTEHLARQCEESHNLIVVKMYRKELKALINYLYNGIHTKELESLIQRLYDLDRLKAE